MFYSGFVGQNMYTTEMSLGDGSYMHTYIHTSTYIHVYIYA